jgi:DNA-directed RNA polymerase specialized sigma24 family protein
MTSGSSVTTWLDRLRAGDAAAAEPLWRRYYGDLVRLAGRHLSGQARGGADGEDLAAAAFQDFCAGAAAGRFPKIHNRDDLWRLLLTITVREVRDHVRYETRDRRDSRRTIAAGDLFDLAGADLDRLAGDSPDPALAAAVADTLAHLLARLPEDLRGAARDQLDGYSAVDSARRQSCSLRTVERRRQRIREFWGQIEV